MNVEKTHFNENLDGSDKIQRNLRFQSVSATNGVK